MCCEEGIGAGTLESALLLEGRRAEGVEEDLEGTEGAEGSEGAEGAEGAEGVDEGAEGAEGAEGVDEGAEGAEGAEGVDEGAEGADGVEVAGGATLPVACVAAATVWPTARLPSEAPPDRGIAAADTTQVSAPSRPSATPPAKRAILLWE